MRTSSELLLQSAWSSWFISRKLFRSTQCEKGLTLTHVSGTELLRTNERIPLIWEQTQGVLGQIRAKWRIKRRDVNLSSNYFLPLKLSSHMKLLSLSREEHLPAFVLWSERRPCPRTASTPAHCRPLYTLLLMQLIILIQFIMERVTICRQNATAPSERRCMSAVYTVRNQALNGNNLISGCRIVSRSWLGAIMSLSQIQFIRESAYCNSPAPSARPMERIQWSAFNFSHRISFFARKETRLCWTFRASDG